MSADLAKSISEHPKYEIALKNLAPSKCVDNLNLSASDLALYILSRSIALPHTVFSKHKSFEIGQCGSSGFTAFEIFSGNISLSSPVLIGAIATPPSTDAPAASSIKI